MRRLLGILLVGGALSASVAVALGAGGHETGTPSYKVELDNAFGLVQGADVKVAGVRAGKISDESIDLKTHKALVGIKVDGSKGDFNAFRADVFCESRPQSLIGEYFIDCNPGTAKEKLKPGSKIPVSHTASTIPADLVGNILRLPYRERLRIIINELGTAVAGRENDLNDALRRASPALRETDKVLAILASESNVIRDLTQNSDTVITALANNRADVGRWVVEARNAAQASAERNVDLAATFHKLPAFLEELRPTMQALGRVADEQTPALRDLNATSGNLTRFFRDLGPFANASRPSFRSLGDASKVGDETVKAANQSGTIRLLKSFASLTPEVGKNLGIILADLDDPSRAVETDPRAAQASGRPAPTGYTGLESLLQYVYDVEQATNVFDQNSYILNNTVFAGECAPYRNAETLKNPNPVSPQPGSPTGPQLIKDCAANLGPHQPGINAPDATARAATKAQPRQAQNQRKDAQAVNVGLQAAQGPATAAPSAPQGGGSSPSKPALPIDVKKTLDQLLGSGNVPKLPNVQLPPQVSGQPGNKQDAQNLLNYLLSP
jgi:virulence factor Mce-like protein